MLFFDISLLATYISFTQTWNVLGSSTTLTGRLLLAYANAVKCWYKCKHHIGHQLYCQTQTEDIDWLIDWLSMVLHLRQHNIGYTADGFYRSDDTTNSVKALKEGG